MTETISGGAYKQGDTWVDANGKELKPEQVAEAERLQAEQQAQAEENERQRLALEAQANPFSRALAGMQPAAPRAATPEPTEQRKGR